MNLIHCRDWEVRALLDWRKTIFTRLAKVPAESNVEICGKILRVSQDDEQTPYYEIKSPWTPGPVAIKECWVAAIWSDFCQPLERYKPDSKYHGVNYKATPHPDYAKKASWRSSSTMPQWAIRPAFKGAEITRVWVCRLGEMTATECMLDRFESCEDMENWMATKGRSAIDYIGNEGNLAEDLFKEQWNHDNPRNPWRPDLLVWRCEVKLKGKK